MPKAGELDHEIDESPGVVIEYAMLPLVVGDMHVVLVLYQANQRSPMP